MIWGNKFLQGQRGICLRGLRDDGNTVTLSHSWEMHGAIPHCRLVMKGSVKSSVAESIGCGATGIYAYFKFHTRLLIGYPIYPIICSGGAVTPLSIKIQ